jgi:hypothetical protein
MFTFAATQSRQNSLPAMCDHAESREKREVALTRRIRGSDPAVALSSIQSVSLSPVAAADACEADAGWVGSGVRSDKDQHHGGEDQDEGGAGKCPGGPFQRGGLRIGGPHEFAGGTSTLFSSSFRLKHQ